MARPTAGSTATLAVGLAVIVLAIVMVQVPLFDAPALTWDDGEHIFDNVAVRDGLFGAIWSAPEFGLYIPVTRTLWALVYALGGGAVVPFRVLNLLLHVGNVLLVARLLTIMSRQTLSTPTGVSAAGAHDARETSTGDDARLGEVRLEMVLVLTGTAFFALHPAQVAAVAWISGGRDLLATLLALSAMVLHVDDGVRARRWTRDALATLLFVLALLSKPQVAGVPLAIGAWWWFTDRSRLRSAMPMLGLWVVAVLIAAFMTRAEQATAPTVGWATRVFVALDALGFYAREMVWPWPLAADYGRTPRWLLAHPLATVAGVAALVVLGLVVWLTTRRHGDRLAMPAAGMWLLLLLPVLGFVPFEYQRISTVADHYLYLPLVAGAALVMSVGRRLACRITWPVGRIVSMGGALVIIGTIIGTVLSMHRTTVWSDGDETFYRAMLAANADSFSARINLSVLLCERGETGAGLDILDGARTLAAQDAPYLANRAFCLLQAGRIDELLQVTDALQSETARRHLDGNPRAAVVFANSVANALHLQGNELAAFAWLCRAQALQPGDATTAANLDTARRMLGGSGPEVVCPEGLTWERLAEVARPAS
ncbi:hypothetical protein [Gemmatimonas aurantiaca]|uniref:tetratricopeptide repeat protein n=1 Tax=Gemmatimonas aurantiaca TaxID=173480 RepID=UPI00301DB62D